MGIGVGSAMGKLVDGAGDGSALGGADVGHVDCTTDGMAEGVALGTTDAEGESEGCALG